MSGILLREKTLVVQLADLGDLVLAAPAIQHLVETREVTLLTKPSNTGFAQTLGVNLVGYDKQLFDRPSALVRPARLWSATALVLRLRRSGFNEMILLHHLVTRWGRIKFGLLSWAIGAPVRRGLNDGAAPFLNRGVRDRGFGAESEAEYWRELAGGTQPPNLQINRDAAKDLLEDQGIRQPYLVVHPGSGPYSLARRWPIERFIELVKITKAQWQIPVVVVGTRDEAELGHKLKAQAGATDITGETDLPTLMGILATSIGFVGNDGGVAQCAGLLDLPGIVIFGPTSPATWRPLGGKLAIVHRQLVCSPCVYRYHDLGTPEGCATRECLLDLEVGTVVDQLRGVLNAHNGA